MNGVKFTQVEDLRVAHIGDGPIAAAIFRDSESFTKKGLFYYDAVAQIGGQKDIIAVTGPEHQDMRRYLAKEVFANAADKIAELTVQTINESFDEFIRGKYEFDVEWEMRRVFGRIIGKFLFSGDLGESTLLEMVKAVVSLLDNIILPDKPKDRYLTAPRGHHACKPALTDKQVRSLLILNSAIADIIEKRKERMHQPGQPNDVLTHMLQAGCDVDFIEDNLLTLFIAGHDNMAVWLTMTMKEVSARPAVIQKIQAETDSGNSLVLAKNFNSLNYTRAVAEEGLRYRNPVSVLPRLTIRDITINGVEFKKSDVVVLHIHRVHMNEKYWRQPNDFNPDRFLGEIPKDSFMPFSLGGHACLGAKAAMAETKLSLASIFSRANIKDKFDSIKGGQQVFTWRPFGNLVLSLEAR